MLVNQTLVPSTLVCKHWFPGTLVQVEPYRVACPNHVDDVPDVDPDWQAQAQEASEWEEAREKRGAAGHAGDLLRR